MSAITIATNGGQTWPPIGDRSWRTTAPKIAAGMAIPGKIEASATSVTATRRRSRHSVGASNAATIRYAPDRTNRGTALK